MSLVGTRPPTVDEWDKYELHHRARLATKPGLTGMWQVSGRSNITDFEEVVKLDKQYIESLVNQTYTNLEILLIDDGSTDNSGKLAEKWISNDQRIKVYHKKNGGLSDARNYGIKYANPKLLIDDLKNLKRNYKRKKAFWNFINEKIILSDKTYSYKENLKCLNDKYDIFICGSDQIWNAVCTNGLDSNFFLNFVTTGVKIAYAPSLAHENFPQEILNEIKNYLESFDAVSVRENSGKRILVACLTKANKIQISTQTRNHNGIGAEIESESTMAFVEKSVQRDCQGTTIVLQIKENYSFFELRNYIFKYFNYPSVEIDLVNIDEMCTYIDKKDTFDKNISILQFVVHAGKKRKEKLDKTSFDYGFLQKMSNILLDDEDINNLINRIYGILDNVYIETEVTKRVRSVVNKMDEKEEVIKLI